MKPFHSLFAVALLFLYLLLLPGPAGARAAEINGIPFADHSSVGGKALALNGLGLRQATFLKVNVYAGALYLEKLSHDGDQIAADGQVKRIEMVFLRDVAAHKISDNWPEGVEKNCIENCDQMKSGVARLQAITVDMNKGDKMAFNFLPDHVEVSIKDQKPVTIEGKDFSHNLIRCWIGRNPPNSGLKKGLLGIQD